jgi:hypothetical protein
MMQLGQAKTGVEAAKKVTLEAEKERMLLKKQWRN